MAFASVESDGITVESNTATEAQMRDSLGIKETPAVEKTAPVVGDESDGEQRETKPVVPANETPEQKAARERDEQGRFTAKGKDAASRISHLTWEREEAKREAARERAAREELERRYAPREPVKAAEPAKPTGRITKDELQRYKAMPDAPQEKDFEDYGDYSLALNLFATDKRNDEHETTRTQAAQVERRQMETHQLFSTYAERVDAAVKSDPEFLNKLSPEVLALTPMSALGRGERPGPLNALAEEVMRSKHTTALMQFLSDHPERFQRFEALHPREFMNEFAELVSDVRQGAAPIAAPALKAPVVSQAKPPVKAVTASPVVGDEPPGDEADDEAHRAYWNRRELAQRAKRRS